MSKFKDLKILSITTATLLLTNVGVFAIDKYKIKDNMDVENVQTKISDENKKQSTTKNICGINFTNILKNKENINLEYSIYNVCMIF